LGDRAAPLPVSIYNLKRSWSVRYSFKSTSSSAVEGSTVLGVQRCDKNDNSHTCSGILIEVTQEELQQFDIREEGYQRYPVNIQDIFPYSFQQEQQQEQEGKDHPVLLQANQKRDQWMRHSTTMKDDNGDDCTIHVWVYLIDDGILSNEYYPIPQSYVDVVLKGCLHISQDFAKLFLLTTHGWPTADHQQPHSLMDDRHDPLYCRADQLWSKTNAHMLDTLLQQYHPHAIQKRRSIPSF